MTDEQNGSEDFIQNYYKELAQVDELAQLTLKGHLEVEGHLDEVLKAIFFHPECLLEGRLSFFQKAQVARAQALRTVEWPQWRIVLGLNSLRNNIAHGHTSGERANRIQDLRENLIEFGTDKFKEEVRNGSDNHIVVWAAAVSCGFLLEVRDNLIAIREHVDKWDGKVNPDKSRIPMQTWSDDESA
jgi:hypothetical protein